MEVSFTDAEILEASDIIDGFSGREIKNAVLDMLLDKANSDNNDIKFSIEDLKKAFINKKEEKDRLNAENNKIIKERVMKKLSEKNEEARIEQEYMEQNNLSAPEDKQMTDKSESEDKNKEQKDEKNTEETENKA